MLQRLFIASLFSAGTDEQSAYEGIENDNSLGSSVSALITQLQVRPVSLSAYFLIKTHPVLLTDLLHAVSVVNVLGCRCQPLQVHCPEQFYQCAAHLGCLLHLWPELHMPAYIPMFDWDMKLHPLCVLGQLCCQHQSPIAAIKYHAQDWALGTPSRYLAGTPVNYYCN